MFKKKFIKNTYSCNNLIISAMLKRRRFAAAAISKVCDNKCRIRIIK